MFPWNIIWKYVGQANQNDYRTEELQSYLTGSKEGYSISQAFFLIESIFGKAPGNILQLRLRKI